MKCSFVKKLENAINDLEMTFKVKSSYGIPSKFDVRLKGIQLWVLITCNKNAIKSYFLGFGRLTKNPPDSFDCKSSHLQSIGQGQNANGQGHKTNEKIMG